MPRPGRVPAAPRGAPRPVLLPRRAGIVPDPGETFPPSRPVPPRAAPCRPGPRRVALGRPGPPRARGDQDKSLDFAPKRRVWRVWLRQAPPGCYHRRRFSTRKKRSRTAAGWRRRTAPLPPVLRRGSEHLAVQQPAGCAGPRRYHCRKGMGEGNGNRQCAGLRRAASGRRRYHCRPAGAVARAVKCSVVNLLIAASKEDMGWPAQ